MHLAIVSPYPPSITGIGQYGYHVSRMLAHSGLFTRVSVLTGRSEPAHPVESHPVIDVIKTWQPESLSSGWGVASELRRIQPDLVWFNLGASVFGRSPLANLSGFLSPFCSRRMGFPTVVTLHELMELADLRALKSPGGLFAPYGARLLTRIALQADVVCLTMRHYVEWLSEHYNHTKYIHIPIGAYHLPELLPRSANQSREILFFTTLAPFKGLEVLLQAFQALQGMYPGLRLTIAGAAHSRFPEYAGELKQTFGNLTGVRWLGQVPENEVRTLFQQAQIVCIPYTASTGSSSVLYQAATWGRAVVASDLPETQALAREGNLDVTFFPTGDPASLADALKTLLDAPNLQQAQANRNFRAIQSNRPEEICRAYLHAFNLALETRRSPKHLSIPAQVKLESV